MSSSAVEFGTAERRAAERLIELGLEEDLAEFEDATCAALIAPRQQGSVQIVARQSGVLSGLPCAELVFAQLDPAIEFRSLLADGESIAHGQPVAQVSGPLRSLLTGERTALNFLTHLSGVATLTREFVRLVSNPQCQLLDTRKTLPGYRALQKYAVRCGGGTNHRMGLFDGILIKDNHLAAASQRAESWGPSEAVQAARDWSEKNRTLSIEIEVDSLEQLSAALPAQPHIVLLDNMTTDQLRDAVELRNRVAPGVLLEASGGITLQSVTAIAATGVDRISTGALTHSAVAVDLAFDWM